MENTVETKTFRDYRTTLRALSDGVSLFTKKATMLLKATWPLILFVSILGAWLSRSTVGVLGDFIMGTTMEMSDFGLKIGVPALLYVFGMILFYSLVFTLFALYIEKGFLPTIKRKTYLLCPKITKLGRFCVCLLWVLFVFVVYVGLAAILFTVSRWTLILTIPILIILDFWLMNQCIDYVLISDSLMSSIKRSFRITLRGLGSFITVAIVLWLILSVIGFLCFLPSITAETIFVKAQISIAEGDSGILPGYFSPIYFGTLVFSNFLYLLLLAISLSCWCMVYGAVDTRLRIKDSEKFAHQS
jgi:hypothetical protein